MRASYFKGKFKGWFVKEAYGLEGTVLFGTAKNSSGILYDYGYFKLVGDLELPLVPGVLGLSKLGGEFGYNSAFNIETKKLYPEQGTYIAGLSFGLYALSKAVELEVNPARVQFGNEKFTFDFHGELNIPKNKPVFKGEADLILQYPDNIIKGSIGADIMIPPANGFIINAKNNSVNFESNSDNFSIYTTDSPINCNDINNTNSPKTGLQAKILNYVDLKGDILYYKDMATSESCGKIFGKASISFYENFEASYLDIIRSSGYFQVDFSSEGLLIFNNNEITTASLKGNILVGSEVFVYVKDIAYHGEASFSGAAEIKYSEGEAVFSAEYNTQILLEKLDDETTRRTYKTKGNISKNLSELNLSE